MKIKSSLIALLALLLIGPITWGQSINKKGGLQIDLSALNVPEVPASANEAPPQGSDASNSSSANTVGEVPGSQAIVEEPVNDLRKPGGLMLPGIASADAGPMTLVAEYSADGNGKGQLLVTATMEDQWHTYSTTQPPGGPKPSKISIDSAGVKLAGKFTSDKEPEIRQVPEYSVPVEEHHQRVVWKAPIEFASDFKPGETQLKVKFDGLACESTCREVRQTLIAKFVSTTAQAKQTEFRNKSSHASFTAHIEPAEAKPGSQATLVINVKCDPGYHIYSFVPGEKDPKFKTLIVPTAKGDLQWGEPQASAEPHVDKSQGFDVLWYSGQFQWNIPLKIPSDVKEGPQTLEVALMYLTCTEENCDMPAGFTGKGVLNIVNSPGSAAQSPLELSVAQSATLAAKQPNVDAWIDFKDEPKHSKSDEKVLIQATGGLKTGQLTFSTILFALAGGFILNFMPCVLPVIGLKVLGFVEQAGSSRGEVIRLNLAYVLGICSVMWVLAAVTVGMQQIFGQTFGWGQQFTIFEFKLAMAALVFAMALSFLGVWEIPIPGFATSYKSNELMQREGVFGAFAKGLITTILATPCSGPFLGFVFAVTATLDGVGVFVVYTMVGLGMGWPFIALCLTPGAVKLLPKPGKWMETLKEALSFPLLLTVVYFVASIGAEYRIATFSTLIAVWFACWMIGKVPIYSDLNVKVKVWSAAIATAVVWGMVSFSLLGPSKTDMPWEPYSSTRLEQLRQQGKTVMVDFTASWCLNCQMNSKFSIEVPQVVRKVEDNSVATLLADKSDESPEIDSKLIELQGTTSIPFLVIYPADPKADPIVLTGTFTKSRLLEALEDAGPSKSGQTKLTSSPLAQ